VLLAILLSPMAAHADFSYDVQHTQQRIPVWIPRPEVSECPGNYGEGGPVCDDWPIWHPTRPELLKYIHGS